MAYLNSLTISITCKSAFVYRLKKYIEPLPPPPPP